MKNIFEIYQQLNESFQSKYVRMFSQDASSRADKSFKKFIKNVGLDHIIWDKVTDDDVIVYDNHNSTVDDRLKLFRALKADKEQYYSITAKKYLDFPSKWCIIFGYKDDQLICSYSNMNYSLYDILNSRIEANQKPRTMDDSIRNCDTIYLVAVDKFDSNKIQQDRRNAQYDAVPSLDKDDREAKRVQGILGKSGGGVQSYEGGVFTRYCNQIAEKARDRWKKIIAENRFKRDSDTSAVDKIVEGTMNNYLSFVQDSMKAASINKKISTFRIQDVNRLIQGDAKSSKGSENGWISGGLLTFYKSYCEANVDLSQGKSYDSSFCITRRDSARKAITELAKKIDDMIKKYRSEWEI